MSIFGRNNTKKEQDIVVEVVDAPNDHLDNEHVKKEYAVVDNIVKDARDFPTGDKSRDLMILVGRAITEWSNMYNLRGMPPKVLLGQVLALLNSWYKDL